MVCLQEAHHVEFPQHVLDKGHLIFHLEALNAVVALRQLAARSRFAGQRGRLFSDSATAVAIFQLGRGRDFFIQWYTQELWLTCMEHEIFMTASTDLVTV